MTLILIVINMLKILLLSNTVVTNKIFFPNHKAVMTTFHLINHRSLRQSNLSLVNYSMNKYSYKERMKRRAQMIAAMIQRTLT